jgi:hypothetical protein
MNNIKTENNILTSTELCNTLKLTRTTLDRYRQKGMPHFYIGGMVRYDFKQVMVWIEVNQTKFKQSRQKA